MLLHHLFISSYPSAVFTAAGCGVSGRRHSTAHCDGTRKHNHKAHKHNNIPYKPMRLSRFQEFFQGWSTQATHTKITLKTFRRGTSNHERPRGSFCDVLHRGGRPDSGRAS